MENVIESKLVNIDVHFLSILPKILMNFVLRLFVLVTANFPGKGAKLAKHIRKSFLEKLYLLAIIEKVMQTPMKVTSMFLSSFSRIWNVIIFFYFF